MKFSIRDLFLVTMIVALAVGWWVDRRKLDSVTTRFDALVEAAAQEGYAEDVARVSGWLIDRHANYELPKKAGWLLGN